MAAFFQNSFVSTKKAATRGVLVIARALPNMIFEKKEFLPNAPWMLHYIIHLLQKVSFYIGYIFLLVLQQHMSFSFSLYVVASESGVDYLFQMLLLKSDLIKMFHFHVSWLIV